MKPNLNQFSLQALLLMLTGLSCVLALGVVGGRHWFLFGTVVLLGIVALGFGYRWALYGEGYWPKGVLGRMLFVAAIVVLPLLVMMLAQLIVGGIGNQRTWWWPP